MRAHRQGPRQTHADGARPGPARARLRTRATRVLRTRHDGGSVRLQRVAGQRDIQLLHPPPRARGAGAERDGQITLPRRTGDHLRRRRRQLDQTPAVPGAHGGDARRRDRVATTRGSRPAQHRRPRGGTGPGAVASVDGRAGAGMGPRRQLRGRRVGAHGGYPAAFAEQRARDGGVRARGRRRVHAAPHAQARRHRPGARLRKVRRRRKAFGSLRGV
mmetsp:Transcript_7113/g.32110  ORF Transcript_7113/g.32110 Transcript_7113/m.32110 type:complete len:217 (+) Transcript_7113:578-1228(+)